MSEKWSREASTSDPMVKVVAPGGGKVSLAFNAGAKHQAKGICLSWRSTSAVRPSYRAMMDMLARLGKWQYTAL